MDKSNIRGRLIPSFQRALLGMIYPSIRGIAIGFDGLKRLEVICYLDRKPNDEDYANISEVTSEVLADIEFESVREHCQYSEDPVFKLNSLDFWIYLRKE